VRKVTKGEYHIETDRNGGYIEFAARQIYRAKRSRRHIDQKHRCAFFIAKVIDIHAFLNYNRFD
jgi:hypothetical protein